MKKLFLSLLSIILSISSHAEVNVATYGGNIQAAVSAANATHQSVYIPAGNYSLTNGQTIYPLYGLRGDGQSTVISYNIPGGEAIAINTPQAITIKDLVLQNTGGNNNSAAIWQGGNTNGVGNNYSTIQNVQFNYCVKGLVLTSADAWQISNCWFTHYTNCGINVSNVISQDSGDNYVSSCHFTGDSGAIGIYQVSSDGLWVNQTKFNGGATAVQLQPQAGAVGDIEITNCSIENETWGILLLTQTTFWNVIISNNEFEVSYVAAMLGGPFNNIAINGNNGLSEVFGIVAIGTGSGVISGNAISAPDPVFSNGGCVVK